MKLRQAKKVLRNEHPEGLSYGRILRGTTRQKAVKRYGKWYRRYT